MKTIKSVQFIKGIRGTDEILNDNKANIAFVGRSNVGKSSVINSLLGKKDLVKTSSIPGKTREINFFLVNDSIYFVDLPGYGFAKISQSAREKLRKLIIWYLTESNAPIRTVALIVDSRIGCTEFDYEMIDILEDVGINYVVIANKSDKLNQKEKSVITKKLKEEFGDKYFLYSAKNKKWADNILDFLME
ncbi:ribosome biogenesis GTP-binding protein YihA/YsxC [Patescibacteria group bacterium]